VFFKNDVNNTMAYLMSRNIRMVQPAVSPAYLHSIESNPPSARFIRKKEGRS